MIPTPDGWAGLLRADRPWREAYADVRRATIETLDSRAIPPGTEYTTTELAQVLWPAASARGKSKEFKRARQRLFKALLAEAPRGLAEYCHPGDTVDRGDGEQRRPWVWHSKREPHLFAVDPPRCPHCGGLL